MTGTRRLGDANRGPVVATTAAGRQSHRWATGESKEAFEAFRNECVIPAVASALGEDDAAAAPLPSEWFEVKHTLGAAS